MSGGLNVRVPDVPVLNVRALNVREPTRLDIFITFTTVILITKFTNVTNFRRITTFSESSKLLYSQKSPN